jgi:dTDP-4-dehydrorhamnose 3,5-epimerase
MKIIPTTIQEVLFIEPDVFGDERGFFMESWQRDKFAEERIDYGFVQDNRSCSVQGTLRGPHYQLPLHVQGKLVRVTVGEVFRRGHRHPHSFIHLGQWGRKNSLIGQQAFALGTARLCSRILRH